MRAYTPLSAAYIALKKNRQDKMRKGLLELLMGLSMVTLVAAVFYWLNQNKTATAETETRYVVVLDAGHGGNDPGKVGVDGTLEKEINLSIVGKVKEYLEAADVTVVLTREGDEGLYQSSDTNKKRADMQARCQLIEESQADLTVSIHQNSYHDEAVQGIQIFYYTASAEGKRLTDSLQAALTSQMGEEAMRIPKENREYYLLLHTSCPIVIVECGFLSNWEEAAKLKDPSYQDQLAWGIHMGILQYLNGK